MDQSGIQCEDWNGTDMSRIKWNGEWSAGAEWRSGVGSAVEIGVAATFTWNGRERRMEWRLECSGEEWSGISCGDWNGGDMNRIKWNRE